MAVSLSSTQPFLHSSFQTTTSKQPSNPHKTKSFPLNLPSKIHHFCSLSISPTPFISSPFISHNRCNYGSFQCFVSTQDDFNHITEKGKEEKEEDEGTEDSGDKGNWESVETLTRYYKEAVLAGDYHTIAEIETVFYRLETEKNELVEKVSSFNEEITSGKQRYIRLQADFDNFRKRSDKERLTVRTDAQGEVIESLLPMVDSFERAKQQIKPETDREKAIDTSYQGIYKQFVELMRSLRVSVVATVGKPFDPSLHEAISREESQEFREGIVSQEFRRGFILGDRLLRPAMVKVSSGPGKEKENSATQQATDQSTATPSSQEQPSAVAGIDER